MGEPLRAITVPGSSLPDDLLLYTARDFIAVENPTTDEKQRLGINALLGWSRNHYPVATRRHGRDGKHRTHLIPYAVLRVTNYVSGVSGGFNVRTYVIDPASVWDGVPYAHDPDVATISPTTGAPIIKLRDPLPHPRFRVIPMADSGVGGRTHGVISPGRTEIALSRWSQGNPQYLFAQPMVFALVGVP